MKIGIVQFTPSEDKEGNLKRVLDGIADAAEQGARLVLTPETAMYDVTRPDRTFVPVAEPLDGPYVTKVRHLARHHHVATVIGIVESSPDEHRVYNSTVAIGPDGEVLAVYRKIHLSDALGFNESARVSPGDIATNTGTVFDLDGWRFGIITCFDIRFPELVRTLADAGADVILHPSAWLSGPHKTDHYLTFCRARAIENGCYVISANQTPPVFTGGSMAVDPMGVIQTVLHEEDGVILTELSRERLLSIRKKLPLLALRKLKPGAV